MKKTLLTTILLSGIFLAQSSFATSCTATFNFDSNKWNSGAYQMTFWAVNGTGYATQCIKFPSSQTVSVPIANCASSTYVMLAWAQVPGCSSSANADTAAPSISYNGAQTMCFGDYASGAPSAFTLLDTSVGPNCAGSNNTGMFYGAVGSLACGTGPSKACAQFGV